MRQPNLIVACEVRSQLPHAEPLQGQRSQCQAPGLGISGEMLKKPQVAQYSKHQLGDETAVALTQLRMIAEEQPQACVGGTSQPQHQLQRRDRRIEAAARQLAHGVRVTLSTIESKAVPSFSVARTRAGSRCWSTASHTSKARLSPSSSTFLTC